MKKDRKLRFSCCCVPGGGEADRYENHLNPSRLGIKTKIDD